MQKIPDTSQNFPDTSQNFPDISQKFPDTAQKFPEVKIFLQDLTEKYLNPAEILRRASEKKIQPANRANKRELF